jgi:DNA helicase HerA-like ATPase
MSAESLPAPTGVQTLTEQDFHALQFTETLPLTLVSLMERRYLSHFNAAGWTIQPKDGDNARPLFREVVGLGRPHEDEEWALAMPHVLTACHDPGHALVMALHGQGDRHRLYLGGRRIIGAGARSTEDYLSGQESAFKSHLSGLRMGPTLRLDGTEMPELAEFLQTAPVMAAVTGIPSRRKGPNPLQFQSLDRLVNAVGEQRYALLIVAEPLEPWVIDETLDACRHLKSEVHAYIRRTINRSKGTTHSESRQVETNKDWRRDMPYYLYGISIFCNLAGVFSGFGPAAVQGILRGLGPLSSSVQSMGMMANMESLRQNMETVSDGDSFTESGGTELLNANAEACEDLLQQHIERLQAARSSGWWRTAVYVAAESEAAANSVSGALRSLCGGESTALDPIRTLAVPEHLLRTAVEQGQILTMRPAGGEQGHPLGASFDVLGTCLNSEELSVVVNLPQQEIPGLPMRDQSAFALSVPPREAEAIELGRLQDNIGRDLGPVTITAHSLNRHVFVTGITGSGKTNTCMQLLLESYNQFNVPFMVLEPAKTEYRRLLQAPELRGKIRVYSIGGHSSFPFRLNPLSPVEGIPLGRHIDLLKAVFNASFPMFAGMGYVLEEAILDVYTERGWSLYTSGNAFLPERPTLDETSSLTPSLQDLHDQIEIVLARKKYGQEIHQNMGAALRSRLRSLMVGNKGLMLDTRRSTPMRDLFERPTIIELQNLGDDEEKAFVMALLFVMLYEYAERRQRDKTEEGRKGLQHITLVEEAHRLLTASKGPASSEAGDPRGKAVSMFTDMLAEMRAYGEGFIIADQIPTKLAPETMKNSNLKIIHRLVAPDDREAAGSCVNLDDWQMKHLNNLTVGLAIVHDEKIGEAVLTRIHPAKDTRAPDQPEGELQAKAGETEASARSYLYRHAGCHSCPSPCNFYHRLQEAEDQAEMALALRPFFESLLMGDAEGAWTEWSRWRPFWEREGYAMMNAAGEVAVGTTYCAATNAAHDWMGGLMAARSLVVRKEGGIAPPDRLRREGAARPLGELLMAWIGKGELDEEGRKAFAAAREALLETVAKAPPREAPGCPTCPVRCRMLPYVAPHLKEIAKGVQPQLQGTQSNGARLVAIRKAVSEVQERIPLLKRGDKAAAARTWLYCAVTNVPAPDGAAATQAAVLDALRKPPEEIDASELAGYFGGVAPTE